MCANSSRGCPDRTGYRLHRRDQRGYSADRSRSDRHDSTAAQFSFGEQVTLPNLCRRGALAPTSCRCTHLRFYGYTVRHTSTTSCIAAFRNTTRGRCRYTIDGSRARWHMRRARSSRTHARGWPTCESISGLRKTSYVVPLGVAEHFFVEERERASRSLAARERFELHATFVLYAGNHRKHKNLSSCPRVECARATVRSRLT